MAAPRTSPKHPPAPRPASEGTSRARFRIPGLDGVRAVAVATVVVFHLFPGAAPGGFLGVDVFFVVSGFLITALLLRERAETGRIGLVAFWRRRARRLLPALALVLAVATALALAIGGDVLVRIGAQLAGAATFSSNWVLLATGGSYFAETTPELFRNLWSLGVEEQFYLLWPLLLLVLLRLPRALHATVLALGAAASAAAMALLWDPAAPTAVYYGTGTHAFGLLLGALLAVVSERRPERREEWPLAARGALGLVGILALAALLALALLMPEDSPLVFLGGLPLVAALTTLLVAALLVPGSLLARALELPPLGWVGRRSYGIYLWHWPVLVLLAAWQPAWTRPGPAAWALGALALVLSVAAAAVSYRLVEVPIRRDGFRATLARWTGIPRGGAGRRLLAGTAALALVAGTGTATTLAIRADPGVGEAEAAIQAGLDALERFEGATPAPTADDGPEDAPDAEPERPEPAAGDQIVAIGDSVLLAAAPELRERFPGIAIDAAVSRQMSAAPGIVAELRREGRLRPVLVLALGTNGSISSEDLREVHRLLGAERTLVLVTAQAPRGWIPAVNSELSAFAQAYREVELANWHAAVQPRLDVLAGDQVHFGGAGARIFAGAVTDALQRLAELPPLRDDRADLAYPSPG